MLSLFFVPLSNSFFKLSQEVSEGKLFLQASKQEEM